MRDQPVKVGYRRGREDGLRAALEAVKDLAIERLIEADRGNDDG